jgi:hypothetical protein
MTSFLERLQLSVMRALLGAVRPELRAVSVELRDRSVTVRLFHEGAASLDLRETASELDTEIRAEYPAAGPDAITLDTRLVRCDAPGLIPAEGLPVFAREGVHFVQRASDARA